MLKARCQQLLQLGILVAMTSGCGSATSTQGRRAAEPATDGAQVRPRNAALCRVSRALVPMDSTQGDRFSHDPALAQPAWPVLLPVIDLADRDSRLHDIPLAGVCPTSLLTAILAFH